MILLILFLRCTDANYRYDAKSLFEKKKERLGDTETQVKVNRKAYS